ncbi:MAG TPA: phage head closure protein [Rhodanobacteraceae bacterium]|nr:phage head closure protein [Rhodanobacteraceae bacterium]
MSILDIGSLNRQITIQAKQSGVDAAGQPIDTWTNVATVWANIKGETGMASIRKTLPRDGVAMSLDAYSFRIRFLAGIVAGMRVLYDGATFDILQVRMDYAGRVWTDLVCEAGRYDD